jgi:hypothetical protein
MRLLLVALIVCLCALPRAAAAAGPAAALAQAQAHFVAGEYGQVVLLCEPLTADETLARADRAEAWRLLGLAYFFLGRHAEAESALVEFLKLEPDAHLDPALVPPEGVSFFEGVRARHAGELRKHRPKPKRPSVVVALIPAVAQFENEEPVKGWAIGVSGGLLLATNVTTYVMLKDMCSAPDGTCGEPCDPLREDCADKDDPGRARTLRTVNIVSGALLLGVMVYGAVDGYLGWRRRGEALVGVSLSPDPGGGGASIVWTGRF